MNSLPNFNLPPINPSQFQQMVPNLTNDMLVQLAQQARAQGMSEQVIKEGLEYIQSMSHNKI